MQRIKGRWTQVSNQRARKLKKRGEIVSYRAMSAITRSTIYARGWIFNPRNPQ